MRRGVALSRRSVLVPALKGPAIKKMNLIDKRTASVLFTILGFTLLITLIYQARRPLIAFIFAILFAYLLNPMVAHFQARLRASRGLAIAATYLSLGIAIAAFWITAGP